ncbi:MAG: hypothetical protein H7Y41_00250 [Hyphomonadaceae bacterium]|nr:hypothetical protein [Clostridia bacterium]
MVNPVVTMGEDFSGTEVGEAVGIAELAGFLVAFGVEACVGCGVCCTANTGVSGLGLGLGVVVLTVAGWQAVKMQTMHKPNNHGFFILSPLSME